MPPSVYKVDDELEEEVGEGNEGFNFSSPEEPNFSPDLKLFVGNLPFNVDSAALAGLFEQAENVEMVEVIYDKLTGRSRGFGFVTMSTAQEAAVAAQQFNGYEIEGRPLRVNSGPLPPKKEGSSFRGPRAGSGTSDNSNRVYVRNLAWGVDNLALETLFSKQGKFHYGVFFAYMRLREQEIRNLMWISECVAQNQKSRVHDSESEKCCISRDLPIAFVWQ
ncbi:29 kDa ribonucleoprotein B [Forsythia ovata]|uniref:29 kDa ribonucleoprotein B n=1 Tax=Forsythia ovata TaxID=205694 RepID=A0ABD1SIU8_9LAMI